MSDKSDTTDPKEVIRLALVAQFNGGHDEGPYCYGEDAQLIVEALDNAGCILQPPPLTPSERRKRERKRQADLKGFRI